ncbi:amidohydrolase [Sphingobacterium sp. SGR-19]|uniref:amidohydrolase n=1 Tax=Sphingobacterium sp. SGR-19 TaxID=2710886 RepID=UPI0013EB6ED3|nr:amidohydrolase [Sphingobacterium sp. SGR-19]NGM66270.1 amidohydrolase [Sphingobacterium sp. SGR-19]
MKTLYSILLLIAIASFTVQCTTNKEVDLIVYNAKVYTVDSVFSQKEAFAIKDGIFVDMGTSEEIQNKYLAKEVIDAEGKAIYPGFYDAHAHFLMLADMLEQVNLNGTKSYEEVIQKLIAYQRENPDKRWIIGSGWDQNLWEDKNFPTKDSLDKYFPETPIFLSRVDYHTALVNSQALHIAQLDTTRPVSGGLMAVDSLGNFTGILIDNAMELISRHIPVPEEHQLLSGLHKAQDSLFSVGLTSVVEAGLSLEELEHLKKFYQLDSLKIRNYAMIGGSTRDIERYIREGIYESERLTIRSVKLMADGALGSRGACLLEPYSDDPLSQGFLLQNPKELDDIIRRIARTPFQISTHAIGDSTNRLVLDTYGKYVKDGKKRRWRIEHAQVVSPSDFSKFAQFHIIPSVQPTHATSDMYWAENRLGTDRIKGAYAYNTLLKQYGKLVLGSDFPVEHFNPLYGFHAAVARVDKNGFPVGGFQMENAITREQALRGMTIWAAFSCFQEKKRGSIERGKDADFVILDEDIMIIPDNQLREVKTLRTVIAGETVFLRD